MSGFDFSTLRRRTASWIVAGLGASVAALLSLAMAVMAASRPEPVPLAQAGEPVDTGRWSVEALDATFRPADPDAASFTERQDALVVRFRFTNLSAASSNSFLNVASLDVPGLDRPTYLLARDRAMVFDLHPDMPEEVLAQWAWPAGKPVPESLRLVFEGQLHKRRDNLYGAPGWFPAGPVAMLDLPVARPEAAAP